MAIKCATITPGRAAEMMSAKPENVEIEVETAGRSFEHSLLLTVQRPRSEARAGH
ncbi:hypothetical protein COLO4_05141 [Corchorus olitorius]|uniref:Uncharacterized protein n=1 Tax=Corchorus olitorius TaxID=93759 RepID=A0A1R3KRR6_9ROSI|nr:hypothetical protein COLO4_05141 [Corchorus olitorius]